MSAIREISDEASAFEQARMEEQACWTMIGLDPVTGKWRALRGGTFHEFANNFEAAKFIRLHAVQVALDALKAKDGSGNPPS